MDAFLASLAFFVRSDIFDAGRHPEDGETMVGETWYVVAEAEDGRRWAHRHGWTYRPCAACIAIYAFDGGHMTPEELARGCGADHSKDNARKEVAVAECELLIARIRLAIAKGTWAGPVGNAQWVETQPCYGSAVYQNEGWEAQNLAQELKDDDVPTSQWPAAALAAAH